MFIAIEEEFAKTIGLSEHQRHCGVHKNTNNLHMHVAYNMIHPERLPRHDSPARSTPVGLCSSTWPTAV
ncbi:relaxase/mobilization nuclease domain-containing protein [Fundidesulfovibrio putealis]|uniref:relaxase/mobilization nuclease domain-containing protein n=1 Tax=Fundidesulfovibrio putealis TaxID=270496 RepID=UPI001F36AB33|nr:relaxase/mobilization nuclease domain-containing protein [Fundidesulfovibrio putealis]